MPEGVSSARDRGLVRARRSSRAYFCASGFSVRLLAVVVGVVAAASSFGEQYTQEAVKAAFLHRFTAYVEWPAPPPADEPFTIAVFGADDVATQLEQLLPRLNIGSRPARVVRVAAAADMGAAQILYIGPGSLHGAKSLIDAAIRRSVLVVTDEEGGLAKGAVINFVRVGTNVRFEVSLPAADRGGLKLNSGLLAVAVHVEGRPQGDVPRQSIWRTADAVSPLSRRYMEVTFDPVKLAGS